MANKVFYEDDARRRILGGAKAVYDAVSVTAGPKGRNVVINKGFGSPTVSHDGVFVANAVDIADEDDETLGYRTGAELIKQSAKKMGDSVGDGTSTVTILTYHILNEANKLIAAGHNPMLLRKGLELAVQDVVTEVEKLAEDIKGDKKRIAEIATISAGDKEIGDLIADILDKVGADSNVTIEVGQTLNLESEVVEGFTFDRGFTSPYFVTDTSRMEAEYDKPAILVTDMKVDSAQAIIPLYEALAKAGRKNLVIIADDALGDALQMMVFNKLKGAFNTLVVKAPSFGDRRTDTLEDIAALTGAKVLTERLSHSIGDATLEVLGSARKVIATKDRTTIIEGAGAQESIALRLEQLTTQIKVTSTEYEQEFLEKRLAALSGKVAVIKVGGATETEIEEKKFRVDDAVAAAKAALEGGIVDGGGVTLLTIADKIDTSDENGSVAAGKRILQKALEQPFRILLRNAGMSGDEWVPKIRTGLVGYGINVNTEQVVNLKKAGIIDPASVTKNAVLNAASIAGTGMTMGALIVDIPQKELAAIQQQAQMM